MAEEGDSGAELAAVDSLTGRGEIDVGLSSLSIQDGEETGLQTLDAVRGLDSQRSDTGESSATTQNQPVAASTTGDERCSTESTASPFGGFKIMQRESAGRSNSPRNRAGGTESGVRDRRNMTIEEREAAYREARQRIFGSEEGSGETSAELSTNALAEVEGRAVGLESESSVSSRGDSRKGTPGRVSPAPSSTSSSSSTAFLRAGAPSFDPAGRGAPVESQWHQQPLYSLVDANGQQYYPYPSGYAWPVLQHDINGRQIVANGSAPAISPTYSFPTPGSTGSNNETFPPAGPDSNGSSRSTSLSIETEGDGMRFNPVDHNRMAAQGSRGAGLINRSHSVSPTIPIQAVNGHQAGAGSSAGSSGGHVYQGQAPTPPSWNYYQQPTPPLYNVNSNSGRPFPTQVYGNPVHSDDGSGRPWMGYTAASQGPSRAGLMHSSSGSSSHSSGSGGGPGHFGPVPASPGYRIEENHAASYMNPQGASRGRGRSSGPDRFLFDPSKPAAGMRTEAGTLRQAIGKSASAAGMLESKTIAATSNGASQHAPTNYDINRRVSSSSNPPSDSMRKSTPPVHPSLPARPDWVLAKSRPGTEAKADEATSSTSGAQ